MAKKIKEYQSTVQTVLTIAGVAVTLLNLWIAVKLSPIAKDISNLAIRVEAMEQNQDNFVTRKELEPQLKIISDNIQTLLNIHLRPAQ